MNRRPQERHRRRSAHEHDPRERELPPAGMVTLEDPETGQVWLVDTSPASVRSRYAEAARQEEARITAMLARAGVKRIGLSTDRPFVPLLDRFFRSLSEHPRRTGAP